MKLFKSLMICLSSITFTLTACNSSNNQDSGDDNEYKELFAESKKDELFNLGKTTGYEISSTTINDGKETHYKAAMKGNVLYFYYQEKSGGGWNYMAAKLSDDGKTYTSCAFLDDLSQFGTPIQRGPEAYKSGQKTSVEPYYEASQPAICNNSKFIENDTILNRKVYKFEYSEVLGNNVTHKITSYVEEEYGLTMKIVTEYLKGEEVTNHKEMNITSFKIGNDVVIPNFNFEM